MCDPFNDILHIRFVEDSKCQCDDECMAYSDCCYDAPAHQRWFRSPKSRQRIIDLNPGKACLPLRFYDSGVENEQVTYYGSLSLLP